tara:strand:- start:3003 stop:3449 length:447 start_codon:yes stop_codon:yes gene_type:complete
VGTIYYGGDASAIDIEDRALAHLKVVIATKLRRGESFTLTWRHPDDHPRGRSTVWLSPSIPLRFVFDDPEPAVLSREWMEELAQSANSSGGIMLVAEHFDVDPAEDETTIEVDAIVAKDIDVDNATVGSVQRKAQAKAQPKAKVDAGD